MSTVPSVSAQISGPVVRSWASGLAGFSNCPAMMLPGMLRRSSSALATAPAMPSAPGVSTISAP